MKRNQIAAGMTALLFIACGGGTDATSGAGTATGRDALAASGPVLTPPVVTVPPLPAVQYFERWDGRTPFFNSLTRRATTLFSDSPLGGTRFRAYGVDTLTGAFTFQVDGPNSLKLQFEHEIMRENQINVSSAAPANKYMDILASQGPVNPPHIGPNGVDPSYLWNAATAMEKAYAAAF